MRARMCLALALAGIGLTALPALADAPAYLTPRGFEISLNRSWGGAREVAVPGRVPIASTAEPSAIVWATTCGAGKQVVTLTRKVELYGPPADLEIQWNQVVLAKTTWRAFRAVSFSANGKPLGVWNPAGGVNSIDVPPAVLQQALHDGSNELEVRAERAALPKGQKRCNAGGRSSLVGLTAVLKGSFRTDMRVGKSAEPTAYRKSRSGVIRQFVKNESTTRAQDVEFEIFNGNSGMTIRAVAGDLCALKPGSNTQTLCKIGSVGPGEQVEILVGWEWTTRSPTGWDHTGQSLTFYVRTSTPDGVGANDNDQQNFVMCEEGSKYQDCATAT